MRIRAGSRQEYRTTSTSNSGDWCPQGAGERLYSGGPWQPTRPGLGYQLPLTPGDLFHTAVKAINAELTKSGQPFWEMSPEQQDDYLNKLEAGGIDLNGVPSDIFFGQLWGMTIEGFFCDPVYGGNKDMVAWKLIGFPGAYASYYDLIDQHGIWLQRRTPPVWDRAVAILCLIRISQRRRHTNRT